MDGGSVDWTGVSREYADEADAIDTSLDRLIFRSALAQLEAGGAIHSTDGLRLSKRAAARFVANSATITVRSSEREWLTAGMIVALTFADQSEGHRLAHAFLAPLWNAGRLARIRRRSLLAGVAATMGGEAPVCARAWLWRRTRSSRSVRGAGFEVSGSGASWRVRPGRLWRIA